MQVTYQQNGNWIEERTDTGNEPNTPSIVPEWKPYRWMRVSLSDSSLTNDGSDIETVTVKVVDGLDVARGESPTVLDYDGDVILSVDGNETVKTLTNGSVEFGLTTDKPGDSEIKIVAESLADHPAESDSAMIEVVST